MGIKLRPGFQFPGRVECRLIGIHFLFRFLHQRIDYRDILCPLDSDGDVNPFLGEGGLQRLCQLPDRLFRRIGVEGDEFVPADPLAVAQPKLL